MCVYDGNVALLDDEERIPIPSPPPSRGTDLGDRLTGLLARKRPRLVSFWSAQLPHMLPQRSAPGRGVRPAASASNSACLDYHLILVRGAHVS